MIQLPALTEKRYESGQAMVEFALTAVVFLSLIVFLVEGTSVYWSNISVQEAARVGARYGIIHGKNSATPLGPSTFTVNCWTASTNPLCQVVQSRVAGLDPSLLNITASWDGDNDRTNTITVRATYNAQAITGLFWSGTLFTLVGESSMPIQN